MPGPVDGHENVLAAPDGPESQRGRGLRFGFSFFCCCCCRRRCFLFFFAGASTSFSSFSLFFLFLGALPPFDHPPRDPPLRHLLDVQRPRAREQQQHRDFLLLGLGHRLPEAGRAAQVAVEAPAPRHVDFLESRGQQRHGREPSPDLVRVLEDDEPGLGAEAAGREGVADADGAGAACGFFWGGGRGGGTRERGVSGGAAKNDGWLLRRNANAHLFSMIYFIFPGLPSSLAPLAVAVEPRRIALYSVEGEEERVELHG